MSSKIKKYIDSYLNGNLDTVKFQRRSEPIDVFTKYLRHDLLDSKSALVQNLQREYNADVSKYIDLYFTAIDKDATVRQRQDFVEYAFSTDSFRKIFPAITAYRFVDLFGNVERKWESVAIRTSTNDPSGEHEIRWVSDDGGMPDPAGELDEPQTFGLRGGEFKGRIGKFHQLWIHSKEARWLDVYTGVGLLAKIPDIMTARHLRRENYEVFKHLVSPSGVNTTFFNTDNKNVPATGLPMTVNEPLSLTALQKALTLVRTARPDLANIGTNWRLVVTSALELTAESILATRELRFPATGNEPERVTALPASISNLSLVVSDEILKINPNASNYWYLIPEPGSGTLPNFAGEFLDQQQGIQLFYAQDQYELAAGEGVGLQNGTFDVNAIKLKSEEYFGGYAMSPAGTFVSTGSGT